MSAHSVKIETRCKHIARDMTPLAEHIKQGFTPHCNVISISRIDWKILRDSPEIARANGFFVEGDTVEYRGIRVRPI